MLVAIMEDIVAVGGRPYEVGGCVRDRLVGVASKDIDIEVFHMKSDVPPELAGTEATQLELETTERFLYLNKPIIPYFNGCFNHVACSSSPWAAR